MGLITADFKALFKSSIDSLLETTGLTLPCRPVFTDNDTTECPNCYFDSISNRSSNTYRENGPIPFYNGNCPYCYGVGLIYTDTSLDLSMVVIWNYKDWIGFNGIPDNTLIPFGQAQTMSALSTLSSIKRSKELIIDTNLETYTNNRFERTGEPNPIGLGSDDYIVTTWKKIG